MQTFTKYEQDLTTLEGKAQRLCTAARQNSRKRGQEEPSLEFFIEMLRKYPKCKWTGVEFTYPSDTLNAPSLDRIDSSKGYYEDNIHVVTWQYNLAKNNGNDEDLLEFCKRVVNYAELKKINKEASTNE